ncbi:uncharacterized protein LOC100186606 [Ciona intestinalis]
MLVAQPLDVGLSKTCAYPRKISTYSAGEENAIPGQMQTDFPGLKMYPNQTLPMTSHYNTALPTDIGTNGVLPPHYGQSCIDQTQYYSSTTPNYDGPREIGDTWSTRSYNHQRYAPYNYAPQYNYDGYQPEINDQSHRKSATRESTNTLKAWLQEHKKNPYPTKGEKIMLAIITKMTLTQVSTWFANARRRLKKENKMTWVPKNRSNENTTVGDDKKQGIEDGNEDVATDNEDFDLNVDSNESDKMANNNTATSPHSFNQSSMPATVSSLPQNSAVAPISTTAITHSSYYQNAAKHNAIWSPGNDNHASYPTKCPDNVGDSHLNLPPSFRGSYSDDQFSAISRQQQTPSAVSPSMISGVDLPGRIGECRYPSVQNWVDGVYHSAIPPTPDPDSTTCHPISAERRDSIDGRIEVDRLQGVSPSSPHFQHQQFPCTQASQNINTFNGYQSHDTYSNPHLVNQNCINRGMPPQQKSYPYTHINHGYSTQQNVPLHHSPIRHHSGDFSYASPVHASPSSASGSSPVSQQLCQSEQPLASRLVPSSYHANPGMSVSATNPSTFHGQYYQMSGDQLTMDHPHVTNSCTENYILPDTSSSSQHNTYLSNGKCQKGHVLEILFIVLLILPFIIIFSTTLQLKFDCRRFNKRCSTPSRQHSQVSPNASQPLQDKRDVQSGR